MTHRLTNVITRCKLWKLTNHWFPYDQKYIPCWIWCDHYILVIEIVSSLWILLWELFLSISLLLYLKHYLWFWFIYPCCVNWTGHKWKKVRVWLCMMCLEGFWRNKLCPVLKNLHLPEKTGGKHDNPQSGMTTSAY